MPQAFNAPYGNSLSSWNWVRDVFGLDVRHPQSFSLKFRNWTMQFNVSCSFDTVKDQRGKLCYSMETASLDRLFWHTVKDQRVFNRTVNHCSCHSLWVHSMLRGGGGMGVQWFHMTIVHCQGCKEFTIPICPWIWWNLPPHTLRQMTEQSVAAIWWYTLKARPQISVRN